MILPPVRTYRATLWLAIVACVGSLAGCQRDEYDISLKPTPEGLERTVKLGEAKQPASSDSNKQDGKQMDKPYGPSLDLVALKAQRERHAVDVAPFGPSRFE